MFLCFFVRSVRRILFSHDEDVGFVVDFAHDVVDAFHAALDGFQGFLQGVGEVAFRADVVQGLFELFAQGFYLFVQLGERFVGAVARFLYALQGFVQLFEGFVEACAEGFDGRRCQRAFQRGGRFFGVVGDFFQRQFFDAGDDGADVVGQLADAAGA